MPIHSDGTWYPQAWTETNVQLQEDAKRMNNEAFASAFAQAGKHSQPSTNSNVRPEY